MRRICQRREGGSPSGLCSIGIRQASADGSPQQGVRIGHQQGGVGPIPSIRQRTITLAVFERCQSMPFPGAVVLPKAHALCLKRVPNTKRKKGRRRDVGDGRATGGVALLGCIATWVTRNRESRATGGVAQQGVATGRVVLLGCIGRQLSRPVAPLTFGPPHGAKRYPGRHSGQRPHRNSGNPCSGGQGRRRFSWAEGDPPLPAHGDCPKFRKAGGADPTDAI